MIQEEINCLRSSDSIFDFVERALRIRTLEGALRAPIFASFRLSAPLLRAELTDEWLLVSLESFKKQVRGTIISNRATFRAERLHSYRNTILVATCACLLVAGSGYTIMTAQIKTQVFAPSVATQSFGRPLNISNDAYNARYPSVAASGGYVYIAWSEATHGIYLRKSTNYGATFSAALRLSSPGGVTSYPVTAANGSYVYVAWSQTTTNGVSQIVFSSSSDYGGTFTSPQVLSGSVSSVTPAVACWNSTVYVSWTSNSAGANGTFERTSFDGGVTFEPLFQASANRENGIAAWGNYAYIVSEFGGFSFTNTTGRSWYSYQLSQNGLQPWVAASGLYVYVASISRNFSKVPEINIQVSSNNGASFGPVMHPNGNINDDWDPEVAAAGRNVYLAFHSFNPTSVWLVSSSNNGTNWTAPYEAINTNDSTGAPIAIAAFGNSAFSIYGSAPYTNATYWNAYVSSTNDSGSSWTPAPGQDVSQNSVGIAAPNLVIASASVAASGTYGYAAWMANETVSSNSTDFQVFFNGPFTASNSTVAYSTLKCCSFGTTTTSPPTVTGTTYTGNLTTTYPQPGGPVSPTPITIFELIAGAIVVALGIALGVLFLRRRR